MPISGNFSTFTNRIVLLNGVATFCMAGSYTLKRSIMTLEFEELDGKLLLVLPMPTLNIREGQGIRQWLEKLLRGGKKNTEEFEKRPTYSPGSTPMTVFVSLAQGSSGSVAVWISDCNKSNETSKGD